MEKVFYVLVFGGLGNQMFQIAYGLAIASKFGCKPVFINLADKAHVAREWGLYCFDIEPTEISAAMRLQLMGMVWVTKKLHRIGLPGWPSVLVERGEFSLPRKLLSAPRVVAGYWQSPAYFGDQEEQVRQAFRFPKLPAGDKLQLDAARPMAAIHVRRGDYVSNPRSIHLVCDAAWYRAAWHRLREEVENCRALVFSDDPEWARENLELTGDVQYVVGDSKQPAWVDLARMRECQHFVISNSSYSWWAAYLSGSPGKQVIAPRYWFRGVETAKLRICPSSWILL